MPLSRRITVPATAVCVFVLTWVFRFNDPNGGYAGLTDDHFFYLLRGWQILFGELPVRDFVDHGAPLYLYVSAAVQVLFGRGTFSELAFSTTLLALGSALVFWLGVRASGSILCGLVGTLFHVLLQPRFYNYPKILVYTALIPLLWWLADRPGRRPIIWLAVITVIGFLFRHDHGVFAGLATGAMLLLTAVPWRERARLAVLYAALVVAFLSPYLIFIQVHGGVPTYIQQASSWATEERSRTPIVWPGLFDNPDGPPEDTGGGLLSQAVASVHANRVAWLYLFEIALPLVVLAIVGLSRDAFRPGWPNAVPKITVVALLGLILDAGFLRSPLAARLADPSVPAAILIAWLAAALPRLLTQESSWRPSLRARLMPARAAVVAASLPLAFVVAAEFTYRIHDRLDDAYLLEGPRQAVARMRTVREALKRDWNLATWPGRSDGPALMTLVLYLNSCTTPDSRIFVQPYIPQVLALARRGFAAGYGDLRPGFFDTPEAQQGAIQRMRAQHVPVVLLETDRSLEFFRDSFPVLREYLDRTYEVAGSHVFDDRLGITLLIRSGEPRATPFEPLGWPCPAQSH